MAGEFIYIGLFLLIYRAMMPGMQAVIEAKMTEGRRFAFERIEEGRWTLLLSISLIHSKQIGTEGRIQSS